jgi:uridylate kinase
MENVKVFSIGGSIIAPEKVNIGFIKEFYALVSSYLSIESNKVVLVCGGGGPAREYQAAYRGISGMDSHDAEDRIGIAATRLNGELLRFVFVDYCRHDLVTDPTAVDTFPGQVLVAAGWKPGFSTDYDAVLLAERFKADTLVNLSNVEKVYTEDPRKNPDAKPIDEISWLDFAKIVGETWTPGANVPFDPVATKHAARIGLRVIMASGANIENIGRILRGEKFIGTIIGPG